MKFSVPKSVRVKNLSIKTKDGKIPLLILSPNNITAKTAGVLWIHGGGYITGMKEMAFMGRAVELVEKFKVVVISPDYRLAFKSPYPAAISDCYKALLFMKKNADKLGIRDDQIMVGGESAGGGLTAALCMLARDRKTVNIAFQMPLYPMMDCFDTESSKDNHDKVWNTARNHFGWKAYLRENYGKPVSPYASASQQTDYRALPPPYTFVADGEPFYSETLKFVDDLGAAGVTADVDVYHGDTHAFDMMKPDDPVSREAINKFNEKFEYALQNFFAEQTNDNKIKE